MLSIVQGNRLERLAAALIAQLAAADAAPLAARIVVVPSAGMARWLKHRIAQQLGVCAQIEFPYPAQFAWQLFGRVLPHIGAASPFDRDTMGWRLFGLLGRLPQRAALTPLHHWLDAGDERARMELAQRLAALFDQYLVLRSDWLAAWGEGRSLGLADSASEAWQSWLWRQLLEASAAASPEHPKEAFFDALAAEPTARSRLPARVAVFGVPLLPPLYLEILLRLAGHLAVDLYAPNPCREFWADIVAERDMARLALKGEVAVAHREVGHPLLAAWGKQSRDQLAILCALADQADAGHEDFVVPAGPTLLARVQRSVVELDDAPAAPMVLLDDDDSLRVHACHGLTRQIEVLHDQLLACFERRPGLAPGDVLVMTPDIDAAAAAIDAVFGAAPRERHIPYTITGGRAAAAGGVLAAFAVVLALPESRCEVGLLFDLLASPAVARRFALAQGDIEVLREWLREAGVRWGLDAEHRQQLGLPKQDRHSWSEGLRRILLGYAMSDDATCPLGPQPLAGVEGQAALALGKLLRFLAVVEAFLREAKQPRPPAIWVERLQQLALALLDARDEEAQELLRLGDALAALKHAAGVAGVEQAVGLAVMRQRLADLLLQDAPGAVPSGAVTFCGIGPLRGLPCRVLCMVGLDAESFPRRGHTPEFDLMVTLPRLGDRARHEDDRGAFLDALMAARDAFILIYNGRDPRDNTPREPALPVAELLDYLSRRVAGGPAALAGRVSFEHPLQAFSPRNFAAAAPRSYAADQLAAARVIAGLAPRRTAPPLAASRLDVAEQDWRCTEREQLAGFMRHPLRFFLRRRLGIALVAGDQALPTEEPFRLDGRERWRFAEALLTQRLAGRGLDEMAAYGHSAAALPHGAAGDIALAAELQRAKAFAERIGQVSGGERARTLAIDLECAGRQIGGALPGVYSGGHLLWRLGRVTAGDLAHAWLDHLLLQALAPPGVAPLTHFFADSLTARFAPVEDWQAPLALLLDLYREGLSRPLPIPPRAAWAWFRGEPEAALKAARSAWAGSDFQRGECADPWFRLAYGGLRSELPEGFEAGVTDLLGPLREHLDLSAEGGA